MLVPHNNLLSIPKSNFFSRVRGVLCELWIVIARWRRRRSAWCSGRVMAGMARAQRSAEMSICSSSSLNPWLLYLLEWGWKLKQKSFVYLWQNVNLLSKLPHYRETWVPCTCLRYTLSSNIYCIPPVHHLVHRKKPETEGCRSLDQFQRLGAYDGYCGSQWLWEIRIAVDTQIWQVWANPVRPPCTAVSPPPAKVLKR
jgi:hypothetical protein